MIKAEHATCKKCKYRYLLNQAEIACNYMDVTGKSRVFKDGKKVIPDGFCDKFVKGRQDRSVADRWVRSSFFTIQKKRKERGTQK